MPSDCLLLLLFFRSTMSEPRESLSTVLKDVAKNSNLGRTRGVAVTLLYSKEKKFLL